MGPAIEERRLEINQPLREAVEVIKQAVQEAQYVPGLVGPHITGIKLQGGHVSGVPGLVGTSQFNHSAEDERFISFLVDKLQDAGIDPYDSAKSFGSQEQPSELTSLIISYPHGRVSRQKRAKVNLEDIRGESLKELLRTIGRLTKGPHEPERLNGKVTVWARPDDLRNPLRTTMVLDREAYTDDEQGFQRASLNRLFGADLKRGALAELGHQYTLQTRFEIDLSNGEVTEVGPLVADELSRAEHEVSELAHRTYNDAVPELRSLGSLKLGCKTASVIDTQIIPAMHRDDGRLSSVVFDLRIEGGDCSVSIRSARTDSGFSFTREVGYGGSSLLKQLKEAVSADYEKMAQQQPEAFSGHIVIAAKGGRADVRGYQRVSLSGLSQVSAG